jgi:hypothetical protein
MPRSEQGREQTPRGLPPPDYRRLTQTGDAQLNIMSVADDTGHEVEKETAFFPLFSINSSPTTASSAINRFRRNRRY